MATLVTGAGLIGTAFAAEALARAEPVVFLDPEPREDFLAMKLGKGRATFVRKDVRDLPALIETMKANRVDTVVHTAGLIGPRVQQALSLAFDINLGGTRNVAEAVRLTDVRRLVHISTLGVYDRRHEGLGPVPEDAPRGQGRAYGNYKAAKELILETYANTYGFELIMLRPANVFGLGHFWSGSSNGLKMQSLIEAGFEGVPAHFAAADTATHEYVYAKDVGRAVDLAATKPMPAQNVFNIGNGYLTTFEELVAVVKTLCPSLRYNIEPGEAPAAPAPLDISAAKHHLDWEPRFTIATAFADYLAELKAARAGAGAR
jgi:nucleoside-diphosphate-sugar epimerase